MPARTLRLVYFAWVREKIGLAEERVELPTAVETVDDLIIWLKARGPEYAAALERSDVIRVAIDRAHAPRSARLDGAVEIGFFPPVTGG